MSKTLAKAASIALAAAGTATLIQVAAAPAANAATYYGAISVSDRGAIGRAWDYPSSAAARTAANRYCGYTSCDVLTTFANGCGAIAFNGRTYQGGSGRSLWEAQTRARSLLGGGNIISWVCTSGHL